MTDDFSATASELRYAVFRLARRLRSVRAVDEMSDAQLAALGALRAHGRHTLSRLAEHERVTAPTMTATINGLAELGLVVRIPDEHDRRRVHVELTEQGENVVAETIRRRDERLSDMITDVDLDGHDLAVLREAAALLKRMADS
ncbi:MarR family transcriptional regulator [Microbacterium sp. H1-D42]|uniref:MarR family winged helix-turn-helix transcriptional regulator n=1 Tax=Microbacterium sp. H1-D42 TaxID=2925844 RepID=UPI001F536D6C|nr:MarR family transcriptional regulator [Microbacterium sp. H1-D42]UNK71338.1 MarR family transcriptional regulator [Microbacterium sp. H1-D42]